MKRSLKSLMNFTMGATDGEIGKVKDFYFDDHTWTIRYLIVETGSWLDERKVLISPEALLTPDFDHHIFPVNLTKDQIKHSPDIDTEKPVSRQQELELNSHYPWTNYWAGSLWGGGLGPGDLWAGGIGTTGMMMGTMLPLDSIKSGEDGKTDNKVKGDPQLRSDKQVMGYNISATDGSIGDVEDFIVNDANWKIELLVVDTGNWLPGKKVLISPEWIKEIDWTTSSVVINASIDKVKNSPEYHSGHPISDDYHTTLHEYYGNDE